MYGCRTRRSPSTPPRSSSSSAGLHASTPANLRRIPTAVAAYWLTLDAINFGSGWFPTLRKRAGQSGYHTIAAGLREHFDAHGPWSAASPAGAHRRTDRAGHRPGPRASADGRCSPGRSVTSAPTSRPSTAERFSALARATGGSAAGPRPAARRLCRASPTPRIYDELELPFLKRAQIAAADLAPRRGDRGARSGPADDVRRQPRAPRPPPRRDPRRRDELVARIEREELIEHDSPRGDRDAGVRAARRRADRGRSRRRPRAAAIDELLWHRGQGRPATRPCPGTAAAARPTESPAG